MDGSKTAQLLQYIARGWALVPLHDVSTGVCSCGVAGCKSAGKHPRAREWQRPEHLVLNAAGLARWPAESNWGLATGVISGVWAVDYDPKAVTDPAAAGAFLLRLQEAVTWTQRTGSGGQHWVFALPDDFVPNNSARRLPDGFDVRGARRGEVSGGQIVLAPSVSGVGPYVVFGDPAAAVRPAPAGVVELVRPAPPRERRVFGVTVPLDAGQTARYVATAAARECAALEATPTGRNGRAFAAACRVLELANTGLVDRDTVHSAWWAAAAAHPDPMVTVPERELLSVWGSAERHVGDRPADLSGVGGAPGWMGGAGVIPFVAPDAVPPLGLSGSPVDPDGGRDSGVTTQVIAVTDPVEAMLGELLTVEQLKTLPPPQPLINGMLDLDTTSWLIGESGAYKSFVGLDLAAHVGRGEPWRGRAVRQGEVIYVVAEGSRGMKLRVEAWEREYGVMKDVMFLSRPVQANGPEWAVLVEVCRRRRPVLVVIDTQARVTIGLDENSNSDMSLYAERADEIKRATQACVLTVHHLGRNGTNARGASAIDGAQDAELRIEKVGTYSVTLHMDKQKDQVEAPPIAIRLRRSEVGTDPDTGRDLSSLVLDHAADGLGVAEGPKLPAVERRALALFMLLYGLLPGGGEGITRAEIRALYFGIEEITAMNPDARRQSWTRTWALLLSRGRVMRFGTSQRFAVFPPPEGSSAGMLTRNDGSADDMPPDGWSLHHPEADKALPKDA